MWVSGNFARYQYLGDLNEAEDYLAVLRQKDGALCAHRLYVPVSLRSKIGAILWARHQRHIPSGRAGGGYYQSALREPPPWGRILGAVNMSDYQAAETP
jgi:hypothetical protein